MQDLYKQSKDRYFTYFFIFLLTISLAYAIDECKGTITTDDVPCGVYLPSASSCSSISVEFFTNATSIYSQVMTPLNNFTCQSTFNQSTVGTYTFNYTTGDSGSIVVEAGNKMILLMYFGIIVAFLLMGFGLIGKDDTFASLGAIVLIIMGIFILIYGFGTLDNLMSRTMSLTFWGIGIYVFFRVQMEALKE